MAPQKVNEFMERKIDLDEWILHVKQNILDKDRQLIIDKKHIFVIESQSFKTFTTPSRTVTTMVGA